MRKNEKKDEKSEKGKEKSCTFAVPNDEERKCRLKFWGMVRKNRQENRH
jgi:hypothetical protein